jgi:hypothetical protein
MTDFDKLKDAVAELLRKGLAAAKEMERELPEPVLTKDKRTGLPVVECKHAARASEELSPDRVAEVLLAQEAGWHHGAGR